MRPVAHLAVTWLVALGANFSALWILIANGWMQNPVGATFNPDTMRMEVTNFMEVIFNTVAQAKFVHTVSAGYVTGAVFVLGISALYLLRGRHIDLAKRSMVVAASFGLASALSVVVLGDESGYVATEHQKMKIAAMEAMYHTEPAPAALTLCPAASRRSVSPSRRAGSSSTTRIRIRTFYFPGARGARKFRVKGVSGRRPRAPARRCGRSGARARPPTAPRARAPIRAPGPTPP